MQGRFTNYINQFFSSASVVVCGTGGDVFLQTHYNSLEWATAADIYTVVQVGQVNQVGQVAASLRAVIHFLGLNVTFANAMLKLPLLRVCATNGRLLAIVLGNLLSAKFITDGQVISDGGPLKCPATRFNTDTIKLWEEAARRTLEDGTNFAVAGALVLAATANGVGRLNNRSAVIDAALRWFLLQQPFPLLWQVWCPSDQRELEGIAHTVGLLRVHPSIGGAFEASPAMQLLLAQRSGHPLTPGLGLPLENLVVAAAARVLEVDGCKVVPVVNDVRIDTESLSDSLNGDKDALKADIANDVMAIAEPLMELGAAVVAPCANAQCADVIAIRMSTLPKRNRRNEVPNEENGKFMGRVAFISCKMGSRKGISGQLATLGFSNDDGMEKCQLTPALIALAMHLAKGCKTVGAATAQTKRFVDEGVDSMMSTGGASVEDQQRALARGFRDVVSRELGGEPRVEVYWRFITAVKSVTDKKRQKPKKSKLEKDNLTPRTSHLTPRTTFSWAAEKTEKAQYQTFDFPGLNELTQKKIEPPASGNKRRSISGQNAERRC